MKKIFNYINNLSKTKKITTLICVVVFSLLITIGIPSLARFINRVSLNTVEVWDGTVSTSYNSGTGTLNDPYIISNGSELAYLKNMLEVIDYDNTYFEISKDIVLNEGVLNYNNDKIEYILNGTTYYVDYYTNLYYDNDSFSGSSIGSINTLSSLNGFKGNINGNSFRIYGLYMTSELNSNLGLFTNFEGDLKNLYVENALIYGGNVTGGIFSNVKNSNIENVLFNGSVLGNSSPISTEVNNTLSDVSNIIVNQYETSSFIPTIYSKDLIVSNVTQTSLTGNYVINGESAVIKINGIELSGGTFNVSLGTNLLNEVEVITSSSSSDVTVSFSNLSYNVTHTQSIAGGISGLANNSNFKNVVNKAEVNSNLLSGGIIGFLYDNGSITNSYNTKKITSLNISGGITGYIYDSQTNTNITNCYNDNLMTDTNSGSLLGFVNNSNVNITNSFDNKESTYIINTVSNSVVTINNSYKIGTTSSVKTGSLTGDFVITTTNNLTDKTFINNTLNYNEFISFDDLIINDENVWVLEKNSLPIIYIDDLNNPLVDMNLNIYTFNNYSEKLSTITLEENITFSLTNVSAFDPAKEIYYYVSNSSVVLTKEQLNLVEDWVTYNSIVTIDKQDKYIIYAKIVDIDNEVTYINSDIIKLDLPGVIANLTMEENTWSSYKSSITDIYIDRSKNVVLSINDNISEVSSTKYYISNVNLSTLELDNLESSLWTNYTENILVSELGTNIVYIKIVDSFNYTTYINTDSLILDGYVNSSLDIGRNKDSYTETDILVSSNSTITTSFKYTNLNASLISDINHNLVSTMLFPLNTSITLIDNINKKIYQYIVNTSEDIFGYTNSCFEKENCINKASYPFTMFSELGKSETTNYTESAYYSNNVIEEDFTVIIDFSKTNMSSNYTNVFTFLELLDSDDNLIRPTLFNSLKAVNIYDETIEGNALASLKLTTTYDLSPINYSVNSETNIDLTSYVDYKKVDNKNVIDTYFEDKITGLEISVTDSDGIKIDNKYLQNLIFKIDGKNYYPSSDGLIRIGLDSSLDSINKTLVINTLESNSDLLSGVYYIKIGNYISEDGTYYNYRGVNNIDIPLYVNNEKISNNYGFNVIMSDSDKIINKNGSTDSVSFEITKSGYIYNADVRVSLYKKNTLSAYNQDYTLIDLKNYATDSLTITSADKVYLVTNNLLSSNIFMLNLITNSFEYHSYKYVFDLYSNNKKIGTIEKYFIVKQG